MAVFHLPTRCWSKLVTIHVVAITKQTIQWDLSGASQPEMFQSVISGAAMLMLLENNRPYRWCGKIRQRKNVTRRVIISQRRVCDRQRSQRKRTLD
jgi:hypothetical protein